MRYASRVFAAAVFAALLVAWLGGGSAKADVTFTFYAVGDPSDTLLAFTVPEEPSSQYTIQTFFYTGDRYIKVEYAGDSPYELELTGYPAFDEIVDFDTTSPPGNGDFSVRTAFGPYDVGSATVSGVPVGAAAIPEPSTWATLLLGFAGLGFAGYRASRRTAMATV